MIKFLSKLSFLLGMFVLYIMPKHQYEWTHDMDSSISEDAFVDLSNNRGVFIGFVLFCIILFQAIAFAVTKGKKQKVIPVFLATIAVGFWLFKFGYSF